MAIKEISEAEAVKLIERQESHFWDHKAAKGTGVGVRKTAAAFANADGGEILVGVDDRKVASGLPRWNGFPAVEDGNHIEQLLVHDINPAVPYTIDWYHIAGRPELGFAALVLVSKSPAVHRLANDEVWARKGAQNLRLAGQQITNLVLSKGATSYEDQFLGKYSRDDLVQEKELGRFLESYSPATRPDNFIQSQRLFDPKTGNATVSAAVLYADNPAAVMTRKCSIKIARYETSEAEGRREHLVGVPVTIERPAYQAIDDAIDTVANMIQAVKIMEPDGRLAPARYPPEALKEIIVNAVIHRDYNVSDDVLITVFDNRVEVKSPGRLPGHITTKNLLKERFARNPTVVRLLNKYSDPPNKDIGEGLNTAVSSMIAAKLRKPEFRQLEDSFQVILRHRPLARPEELVLEYLHSHDEVTNSVAREFCGIHSENAMKDVFIRLFKAGHIEPVPGKKGSKSAWRRASGAPLLAEPPDFPRL